MDVSKQSVLCQGWQGAHHAAKSDIATGFKPGRGTNQKTNCREDPFVRPGARRTHFGRGIFDSSRRFVGADGGCNGGVFRCRLPRLKSQGFGQSPLLDCLTECVELEA